MVNAGRRERLVCRAPESGTREEKVRKTVSTVVRRLLVTVACVSAVNAAPARAEVIDLEKLDGPTAIKMMEQGKLTSVRLTRLYIDRIEALNKRGPGLNAVTSSTRTR